MDELCTNWHEIDLNGDYCSIGDKANIVECIFGVIRPGLSGFICFAIDSFHVFRAIFSFGHRISHPVAWSTLLGRWRTSVIGFLTRFSRSEAAASDALSAFSLPQNWRGPNNVMWIILSSIFAIFTQFTQRRGNLIGFEVVCNELLIYVHNTWLSNRHSVWLVSFLNLYMSKSSSGWFESMPKT